MPKLVKPALGWLGPRRSWLRCGLASLLAWPVCGALDLGATERTGGWPYEWDAGQFRIHADRDLATRAELVQELEQLSSDVTHILQLRIPTSTMHVILLSNESEYRRYMQHYFPGLPERRALFVQQRGTSMLFAHQHPQLAVDLRHESVHALLNEQAHAVPLWLDEGLAEYFEVPATDRLRGHSHLTSIMELAAEDAWPDLTTLEAMTEVSSMSSQRYRDAWAWVHFLLHRHQETRQFLVNHLQALRSGSPVPPLSRTVAMHLPNWRELFAAHFRSLTS